MASHLAGKDGSTCARMRGIVTPFLEVDEETKERLRDPLPELLSLKGNHSMTEECLKNVPKVASLAYLDDFSKAVPEDTKDIAACMLILSSS